MPPGEEKPLGRNPTERGSRRAFAAQKGELHLSGRVSGGLVTAKECENCTLKLEYRWGEKTWPPREANARTSGIGPDGAIDQAYMQGIKCQIREGRTGDVICYTRDNQHHAKITVEAAHVASGARRQRMELHYKPGEPRTMLGSRLVRRLGADPNWKDVVGFSGKQEIEKPHDEWNKLECECWGHRIIVRLNGQVVNVANQCSPHRGRILIESHQAEINFRNIEIQALQPPPAQ